MKWVNSSRRRVTFTYKVLCVSTGNNPQILPSTLPSMLGNGSGKQNQKKKREEKKEKPPVLPTLPTWKWKSTIKGKERKGNKRNVAESMAESNMQNRWPWEKERQKEKEKERGGKGKLSQSCRQWRCWAGRSQSSSALERPTCSKVPPVPTHCSHHHCSSSSSSSASSAASFLPPFPLPLCLSWPWPWISWRALIWTINKGPVFCHVPYGTGMLPSLEGFWTERDGDQPFIDTFTYFFIPMLPVQAFNVTSDLPSFLPSFFCFLMPKIWNEIYFLFVINGCVVL